MTATSSAGPANTDQIAYWNSVAGERWALLQARIDAVFAPLTGAALAFAAPKSEERVVDIGCGAGATVLGLAQAVGGSGHVLGVDVSKPMLTVAERRVAAETLPQATLLLADASTHTFAPRTFDLVFSRFGVMFFADPVAAFANIRTGLVDGGRLAFACWQPLKANPWFEVPVAALRPLLPPAPPADPLEPGPFAFADADRVRGILDAAGFEDIRIEPHHTRMNLGSPTAALDFLTQVGPASRALGDAEPENRPALIDAVRSALASHDGPDGIVLGGAIWLVSARTAAVAGGQPRAPGSTD
ncbi:class I SAM-dependent methyltransferase [Lichenifustis flavocetrariae]|uniref:Class I SAM-dependent methyltransferase n=1 Tax=Lichenifustis flavocetrariae TaxID=2949735 RepID=A0AA41YYF5_9HYPH|nr:class I SAM-dependent methyltransferase [Lichenifustis flavocetrariae]MCW6509600.1 class I SAM-dependent methyltransferase [Lichenifustis flavocetrariae]